MFHHFVKNKTVKEFYAGLLGSPVCHFAQMCLFCVDLPYKDTYVRRREITGGRTILSEHCISLFCFKYSQEFLVRGRGQKTRGDIKLNIFIHGLNMSTLDTGIDSQN